MTVPHYMAGVDRDYRPRERRRSRKSKLDRMLERIKEHMATPMQDPPASACGEDVTSADLDEPGTVVSKLLLANVLMRRERERLRAERDTALAEVPARLKAEREAAALYGALDSASKDGARAVAAAHARGRREAIEEAAGLREKARAVCELEWEGAWRLSDDDTLLFSALRAEVNRP